tara:strand:+ start:1838 stop:2176 length:339 start_codon:yes stop_codon:yes gene_type:complete
MRLNPNTIAVAKSNVQTASAAAATATIAAVADEYHAIDWIAVSYEGTAITGNLLVQLGGVTYFNIDIDGSTYVDRFFQFHVPMCSGNLNESAVITLSSGGSGVNGKLNVGYR